MIEEISTYSKDENGKIKEASKYHFLDALRMAVYSETYEKESLEVLEIPVFRAW